MMWIRVIALTLLVMSPLPSLAASRVKDIGRFAGVRSNTLTGYGLVIGLNKTGDKRQTFFTQQSLINMLERFGLTLNNPAIKVENIAAVMVTADLPAFERTGSRIDVTVSSIGDATSLQGGVLMQTPLLGADGAVYATANGSLILGGYSAGGAAASVTVNHPTVGRIPNGGVVEREVLTGLPQSAEKMELILDRADFTNARRVAEAINETFGQPIASALDSRSVRLLVPAEFRQRPVEFMATVESVSVEVDTRARVVINERTGTVVMGSHMSISAVSIAHGNLSIQVNTQFQVSQPRPFSQGETTVVPQQQVQTEEQRSSFITLNNNATVQDLIQALNALGVTPRDTIAILEALKTAGALQADVEIM
jgi:flagellar P-ring protein precursor FlgI